MIPLSVSHWQPPAPCCPLPPRSVRLCLCRLPDRSGPLRISVHSIQASRMCHSMLKLKADPSLAPLAVNDVVSRSRPLPWCPYPRRLPTASQLPSLRPLIRFCSLLRSSVRCIRKPRGRRSEKSATRSQCRAPTGTVYGAGDPLPSSSVLLSAQIAGCDKDFVVFIAPVSIGATPIALRG